jgi:KDO2-lipid IV(A) lauroyltransferase
MRRTKKEKISDILFYIAAYGIHKVLLALPCVLYPAAARFCARCIFYAVPGARRKILQNIDAVYRSSLSFNEKKSLVRKILEENFSYFFELVLWCKLRPEKARRYVVIENSHILENLMAQKKPVVAISAHFGNFTVMLASLIYKGLPLTWIARDANNPYLVRFMDRLRREKGIHSFNKFNFKETMKRINQWLMEGKILCLLIDQHSRGVEVAFLGNRVQAATGASALARKYGAEVVGIFIYREKNYRHRILVEGPYPFARTGNDAADDAANIQFYYKRIEKHIQSKPEAWFTWFHRRFR